MDWKNQYCIDYKYCSNIEFGLENRNFFICFNFMKSLQNELRKSEKIYL